MLEDLTNSLDNILEKIKDEVKDNQIIYLLLLIILLAAFFVRTYRLDQLLGFFYDQGRDAKVIWDLWHHGDPFLIGPVTGLEGIFLGPFFYYLIAPFYIISSGNPVVPSIFLAFLSTLAVLTTYYLGWKIHSRTTGLIAATISALSYYMILAGRWLSNPTPIMLTSVMLFWSLWELSNNGDKKWWIATALLVGISLQLEAASAFFYIPIVLVFLVWRLLPNLLRLPLGKGERKDSPSFEGRVGGGLARLVSEFGSLRIFLTSLIVFFITLLPQILFNFRHDNLLLNNFVSLFTQEKSFSVDIGAVLGERLNYFWGVFHSKILVGKQQYTSFFTMFSFAGIVYAWKDLYHRKILQLFGIFLIIPAIGYILFQGNYGNIYDYYLTGYYHIFILLFALGLGVLWMSNLGKLVVLGYLLVFLNINLPLTRNYLVAGVDGPTHISLGNEMQAMDWIFEDSREINSFNTSFYVPPVIPHTYEYLMTWQATKRCGDSLCGWEREKEEEIVYILYEQDPPHPERLERWLSDREHNTEVLEEERFGGITVQRRKRL